MPIMCEVCGDNEATEIAVATHPDGEQYDTEVCSDCLPDVRENANFVGTKPLRGIEDDAEDGGEEDD